MSRVGSKALIRSFLLSNIGKIVTSNQISEAAGLATEWARRLRELREDEGWTILTHHDTTDLKPGQYILKQVPPESPVKFARGISAKLRATVLDRNGFTCQMCGLTPGELDPNTGRKVRLHLGHIVDKSLGGLDELSNLRALCSTCNQGAKNVTTEKPSEVWLLAQVRRARVDDQLRLLAWLKTKFPDKS